MTAAVPLPTLSSSSVQTGKTSPDPVPQIRLLGLFKSAVPKALRRIGKARAEDAFDRECRRAGFPTPWAELGPSAELHKFGPPEWGTKGPVVWPQLTSQVRRAWLRWERKAERIESCGERFQGMKCGSCGTPHLFAETCKSRLCPDCCTLDAARLKRRILAVLEHFRHSPRHLVLTIANQAELGPMQKRLLRGFTKLRNRKQLFRLGWSENLQEFTGPWFSWSDLVRGGLYRMEPTWDLARNEAWHAHLHVLVDSEVFLPRPWIVEGWQIAMGCKCPRSKDRSRAVLCKHSTYDPDQHDGREHGQLETWEMHATSMAQQRSKGKRSNWAKEARRLIARNKCTGCGVEPTGQHIGRFNNNEDAAAELGKYLAKGIKHLETLAHCPESLIEFIEATAGARTFSAFGAMHGVKVPEDKGEPRCCDDCGGELEFVTVFQSFESGTAWCDELRAKKQRDPP